MERNADSIRKQAASRVPKRRAAFSTPKSAIAATAGKPKAAKKTPNSANPPPKEIAAPPTSPTVPVPAELHLTDVAIMRGSRVIQQGVNHQMKSGQMTLLTGPNGSGKSSLLRAISGRLTTVRGSITCTAPILYIGHQDGVSGTLSGRQNLLSWAGMNEIEDAKDKAEAAIDKMNANNFADLPTRVLSRGQRRRFALARLCLGPANAIWLLDEPSVGLDIDTMHVLDTLISAHLGSGGMVMAATHLPLAPYARPQVLALNDTSSDDSQTTKSGAS
jgi:heme exporter protein A